MFYLVAGVLFYIILYILVYLKLIFNIDNFYIHVFANIIVLYFIMYSAEYITKIIFIKLKLRIPNTSGVIVNKLKYYFKKKQ